MCAYSNAQLARFKFHNRIMEIMQIRNVKTYLHDYVIGNNILVQVISNKYLQTDM